jgi:hypothetical protein
MRAFVLVLIVSAVAVVSWRMRAESGSASERLERLQQAIDRSALPQRARGEMRGLIDSGRLRPSQYLAGD